MSGSSKEFCIWFASQCITMFWVSMGVNISLIPESVHCSLSYLLIFPHYFFLDLCVFALSYVCMYYRLGLGYRQRCWMYKRTVPVLKGSLNLCVLVNLQSPLCVPSLVNLHLYQLKKSCLCLCVTWVLCVGAIEGSPWLGQPVWPVISVSCLCLCLWDMCSALLPDEHKK